jgi:hypothetical protein
LDAHRLSQVAAAKRSPHGCGVKQVVWVNVLGRRSGCEPPHDNSQCPCRPSFSVRILAMDRHRQRATDGLRVAKGHLPLAADGPIYPQSARVGLYARLDPACFGRHRRITRYRGVVSGTRPPTWLTGGNGCPALSYRVVIVSYCWLSPPGEFAYPVSPMARSYLRC